MIKDLIFSLVGGLGLFLFGMKIMSDGLKQFAGTKLQKLMDTITSNRVVGMLVGLSVTAVIQSSSATTVMVVGLCNAGLVSLTQAISIVLGANIGTTITAQLIAFPITKYALPAIGVGFLIYIVSKKKKGKFIGEIIIGFGLLFLGLNFMKQGFIPFKESESFRRLFVMFGANSRYGPFLGPLLGVLTGAILTMIIQSSSTTVGITMALASSGVIDFYSAVPLILGENIGTTITAGIASIGTNTTAKRVARAHTLFNVFGVIIMILLFQVKIDGIPIYLKFIDLITPGNVFIGQNIERHIANSHTLFNVINTLLFLPLIGLLALAAKKIVPEKKRERSTELTYIDDRLVGTPELALYHSRQEVCRMMEISYDMMNLSMGSFFEKDLSHIERIQEMEYRLDCLQSDITEFLIKISQQEISYIQSEKIPVLLHTINDIERIGDHCINLIELVEQLVQNKIPFSQQAISDITEMHNNANSMFKDTMNAFLNMSKSRAKTALLLEEKINKQLKNNRIRHISRLKKGICLHEAGLLFTDIIMNIEKIGDHLKNINQAVLGEMQWDKAIS